LPTFVATDEDIDALITKGEERTSEIQNKLQTDARHSLANFSLMDDEAGRDTFSFGGKNYRDNESDKPSGNFINLPQRQRKRNYDEYPLEHAQSGWFERMLLMWQPRKAKGPALHDFQRFNMERLNALVERERALANSKERKMQSISEMLARAPSAPPMGSGVAQGQSREELLQFAKDAENNLDSFKLTDAEEQEKANMLSEGFPDWSRKDFKAFCTSMEPWTIRIYQYLQDVMNETKTLQEIQRYVFLVQLPENQQSDSQIERGEKKILRLRQIRDAIQEKVERHLEDTFGSFYEEDSNGKIPSVAELLHYSWPKMKINYGSTGRGRGYQEEEDAFLVCMMYRHGYGAAERIRMEIRRAWQFRFDWFFKSRSAQEIQKRCDLLVRVVERENEELRKKEEEEARKKNGDGDVHMEESQQAPAAAGLPVAAAVMPAQPAN
jgi:SWI/SNF-related matrix-associated actin-dependent regulator of chromatin subfamily A member 5